MLSSSCPIAELCKDVGHRSELLLPQPRWPGAHAGTPGVYLKCFFPVPLECCMQALPAQVTYVATQPLCCSQLYYLAQADWAAVWQWERQRAAQAQGEGCRNPRVLSSARLGILGVHFTCARQCKGGKITAVYQLTCLLPPILSIASHKEANSGCLILFPSAVGNQLKS